MLITATQKFTRQSPRKVRLVANAVKKMPLAKALTQLAIIERKSTMVVMKTVKQAIANAIKNHGLKFEDLKIDTILINEGPFYKRMRAVSRGRGHEIKKRTSHVTVKLMSTEATAVSSTEAQKLSTKPEIKAAAVKAAETIKPAKTTTASKEVKPKSTKVTKVSPAKAVGAKQK